MATIKMCDSHGGMFKEGAEGSSKLQGVIYRRYADGSPNNESFSGDFCPECTHKVTDPNRAPEPAPEPKMLTRVEHAKANNYDPDYVDWLEKQNNVGAYGYQQTIEGAIDNDNA